MSERKKAQIAMEYLVLTAFILVSVAIIFTFSFLNYSQNIRVAKANEALSKIANAVDEVYVRGEGNTRFVNVSFPEAMTEMKIVHKCVEWTTESPNQGNLAECGGSYDNNVQFSAISMTVQLLSGNNTVMRETKAKILETLQNFLNAKESAGSAYTVRVSWTGDGKKIKLERV